MNTISRPTTAAAPVLTFKVTRRDPIYGLRPGDVVMIDLDPNAEQPVRLQRALPVMASRLIDLMLAGVLTDQCGSRPASVVGALIRFLAYGHPHSAVAPESRTGGSCLRLVKGEPGGGMQ